MNTETPLAARLEVPSVHDAVRVVAGGTGACFVHEHGSLSCATVGRRPTYAVIGLPPLGP